MLLRRSLPQLADHRVATDRHTPASQQCRVAAYRQPPQSQPKPLALNALFLISCLRIGRPQTHCVYLNFFQELRYKKRLFFSKRVTALFVRHLQSNIGIPWASRILEGTDAGLAVKTCVRAKLEGGVDSATCQATSEERAPAHWRAAEGQPRYTLQLRGVTSRLDAEMPTGHLPIAGCAVQGPRLACLTWSLQGRPPKTGIGNRQPAAGRARTRPVN